MAVHNFVEADGLVDARNRAVSSIASYFRCPPEFIELGAETKSTDRLKTLTKHFGDVLPGTDPASIIDSLRLEKYKDAEPGHHGSLKKSLQAAYYFVRPATPGFIRTRVQRLYYQRWHELKFPMWPVDLSVDHIFQNLMAVALQNGKFRNIPFIWFWPEGKSSCVMMTHDVEEERGRQFCSRLMDLDDSYAIPASFQIVPEDRYQVTEGFLEEIRRRGHEINVHDLNHDGRLFQDYPKFRERATKINEYVKAFGAAGFRSGAMYRRPMWFDALKVAYDMSIPNVAHMEPQRGGCCTVMPYFVTDDILELPLTTTQDFALFHVLRNYKIDLWKDQIGRIAAENGLLSFIVHPDYIQGPEGRKTYTELLTYIRESRGSGNFWVARPNDVNIWWRARSRMKLVMGPNGWTVEGTHSEKARVAYAYLDDDQLHYTVGPCDPHRVG